MSYDTLKKIKYSDRENYEKIYEERYNFSTTYRYGFDVNGFPVFVVLTQEILDLITNIFKFDKQLRKLEDDLPKVALFQFTQNCLIDEVKQTNDLEGVVSTRKEIKEILDRKPSMNSRLTGIVNKYELLSTNGSISISDCSDIRKLYDEILLDEIEKSNSSNIPDGEIFRKDRVYVRDKNTGEIIHEGLYPEIKIVETMSVLLTALKNPQYNDLINIAVTHYMFGYIHPFYDGNGRISRFISSYLLSQSLEEIVSYRLAYTIKKDINAYYKSFKVTNDKNNKGDLTPFTIYFLGLIEKSMSELVSYFTDRRERFQYLRNKIDAMSKTKDYRATLDVLTQNALFGYEGLSINELVAIMESSSSTIRKNIKRIQEDGLLLEIKGKPYLYTANLSKLETV